MTGLLDGAHRRFNPLTGDYVLVSAQRLQRPWQGQEARPPVATALRHDPECYLCPGNRRANGARNPDYTGPYVFDNDFAALAPGSVSVGEPASNAEGQNEHGLLVARPEQGRCRVVCYSPRHDQTLADLDHAALEAVVGTWRREYEELGADEAIAHVQIFENKGELMGCSNPHPHGQIWAQASIPAQPARVLRNQAAWFEAKGSPMLIDYGKVELAQGERVVAVNDEFLVVVPFWASWPFETLIVPTRQVESLAGFSAAQLRGFADAMGRLTRAYDRLFEVAFPYSSGLHQAPTDGRAHPYCTFHMQFCPPLLRSASVRKFMVGYEMFAEAQRDLTPETAAERLRVCLD
ncbi:MAG: UDP-glucose--hexose-1-phosphate uridylyltransferase [Pseudomonadota bacterium]